MSWIDFNGDGEIDALEMFLTEELLCSNKEEHEALFRDAGEFGDDDWENQD